MTNLKPVAIYTLHPDELENLGYDISAMTQHQFEQIAQGLSRALDDNDVHIMLDIIAEHADLPAA